MYTGLRRYLNTVILISLAGSTALQLREHWRPPNTQVLAVQDVGVWRLTLAHTPLQAGASASFFLPVDCHGCDAHPKEAHLATGTVVGVTSEFVRFGGFGSTSRAKVRMPRRAEEPLYAWVALEGRDGTLYAASWPLTLAPAGR
jgi:hypothetical protein